MVQFVQTAEVWLNLFNDSSASVSTPSHFIMCYNLLEPGRIGAYLYAN